MISIQFLHAHDAEKVAQLLNTHLPFEPESKETILRAGGIQIVARHEEEIVGYIAGFEMLQYQEQFPYFQKQLSGLQAALQQGTSFYTSHLVVHPSMRGKGIGKALVAAYMEEVQKIARTIVVVGWIKSDTNRWDAQKQFLAHQFDESVYIARYFEPYDVYCPNCAGSCYCDARIIWKTIDSSNS